MQYVRINSDSTVEGAASECVLECTNTREFYDEFIYKLSNSPKELRLKPFSTWVNSLRGRFVRLRPFVDTNSYIEFIREFGDEFAKQIVERYEDELRVYGLHALLREVNISGLFRNPVQPKPTQHNPKQEKHTMIKFEHKTFLNGSDASKLSDDEIFDLIAEQENQLASLEKISHKPKKLLDKIEAVKKGIAELVIYVDSRK